MSNIGAAAHALFLAVLSLIGVALTGGGVWLIVLGGSWFYRAAGLAFLGTAVLLAQRRPAALGLYAVLVVGTPKWALCEVGLDWWPPERASARSWASLKTRGPSSGSR